MATFDVQEMWASGEIEDGSARFTAIVFGTDVAAQARLLVYGDVTTTFNTGTETLILKKVGPTKRNTEDSWIVPVEYGPLDEAEEDDDEPSLSFEIGGGTVHITNSFETVGSYAPAGQTAPDFQGAINVTKDNVEGADIPARSFQFSLTKKYDDSVVTQAFIDNIYNLCVCVNTTTFRGRQPGEVLFLGASGSKRGKEKWEITYKFACIPNGNFDVGSIAGITKRGHDLLWIRYADEEDAVAKRLVKRPVAAFVERVLEYDDLNGLAV